MVPSTLIGYCKRLGQRTGLAQHPSPIGRMVPSINWTLTAGHAPEPLTSALISYCTCPRPLIGPLSQLLALHSPFCGCSEKRLVGPPGLRLRVEVFRGGEVVEVVEVVDHRCRRQPLDVVGSGA
ncbi:hypothetical protein NHX12_000730 [Muraenolepis orangiensis]|uniref:Uncharacterized protein n=1 Tax=Muraenolepis orangiensis TaxID=630683 RepID=A0A9Q0IFN7_9TELE|nr:hypothetical protein NHX12_000730 [Muraenolepis orangiensis]